LSFTRFLKLGIENHIHDGTTLWLFREKPKPAEAGLIDKLFDRFDRHLGARGYIARGGRSSTPPSWRCPDSATHARRTRRSSAVGRPRIRTRGRQMGKDARWTKKHGKSFYGYRKPPSTS
jgi:transposase, IS5 family